MQEWVDLIDEMHRRDMYLIADFTVGTMGDYIGFKGQVTPHRLLNRGDMLILHPFSLKQSFELVYAFLAGRV